MHATDCAKAVARHNMISASSLMLHKTARMILEDKLLFQRLPALCERLGLGREGGYGMYTLSHATSLSVREHGMPHHHSVVFLLENTSDIASHLLV